MKCPRCQHENPPQAKFCLECGARVALTCTKCRSELPAGAKFCLECGDPVVTAEARFTSPESYTPKHLAERILTSKAAFEGERKQVTVLFADLKGSMELLADRDPEEARKLLDPVLDRMMEAVHRYEGTVNQVMGDGIMALFGAPLAHEDHAVRACYAALRMQEAVKKYAEEVRRKHGGSVRSRLHASAARGLTHFVGRETELDQLRGAVERAGAGHGQVVAVVGEPGVGKSRLYWEFTHSHRTQNWLILESGSVSYGKSTAYLPVIDLLKLYFQVEGRDETRKIREKVTGKLLSLDRALEPSLPALLSLLDVPVTDAARERRGPP